MKKAASVCTTQCRIANINVDVVEFYAIYACCFTGNILQNNSKGHWEVKIISMAAEGTQVTVIRCFLIFIYSLPRDINGGCTNTLR